MACTEQTMRFYIPFLAFALLLILIDLYFSRGIRIQLSRFLKHGSIKWIQRLNALISTIFILILGYIYSYKPEQEAVEYYQQIFLFLSLMLTVYIPKLIMILFLLADDIQNGIRLLIFRKDKPAWKASMVLHRTGLVMGIFIFSLALYGITVGKFRFETQQADIHSSKLPHSFEGYQIVQLSDFHIGCYLNHPDKLLELVAIVNGIQPDLLVFTGDMVNNSAEELRPLIPILKQFKAKDGKYAILGNHDYGNYTQWDTPEAKQQNHQDLLEGIQESGFDLLLNESREIKRGDDIIYLIGVENIGKPPFPVYGDLQQAISGIDTSRFTILLSHDPSHWDMEVLGSFIDLTLSGHTHGMQAGIELAGIKWSPVQYKYHRWAGLYQEGSQYLYVNRGIGYMGFSGRIGIWPEISILGLYR